MLLLVPSLLITAPADIRAETAPAAVVAPAESAEAEAPSVPAVPFYSQLEDITAPAWKKVGCGVTSLAMVIDYYRDEPVSVDVLLERGVAAGAYLQNVGWTYAGLIALGRAYGLEGESFDYGLSPEAAAFAEFERALAGGPVIASVHYRFEPWNPIPHLVVINGIDGGVVHYNDPAAGAGGGTISVDGFLAAWKQRYIVIRPAPETA